MCAFYRDASDEDLEIIRANECETALDSLATKRFRRFWNEIEDLRIENAALRARLDQSVSECRTLRLERDRLILLNTPALVPRETIYRPDAGVRTASAIIKQREETERLLHDRLQMEMDNRPPRWIENHPDGTTSLRDDGSMTLNLDAILGQAPSGEPKRPEVFGPTVPEKSQAIDLKAKRKIVLRKGQ